MVLDYAEAEVAVEEMEDEAGSAIMESISMNANQLPTVVDKKMKN